MNHWPYQSCSWDQINSHHLGTRSRKHISWLVCSRIWNLGYSEGIDDLSNIVFDIKDSHPNITLGDSE